jgi:hypothetical protein
MSEQVEQVVEVEEGFKATCQCGWFTVKDSELSAKRALAAHMGSCPKSPRNTIGEPLPGPEKAEEEAPEYVGDLRTVAEILHRFGVSKILAGRILDSVQKRPQYLDSPFEFESLLESQRVRGERTIRLVTMETFEELNPGALRGYGSMGEFQPGGPARREFYQEEPDREEIRDLRQEIKDLSEKLHKQEMNELKGQLSGLYGKVQELENRDPFEQIRKYDEYAESRGYTRSGKTTIDLISDIAEKADRRGDRLESLLTKREGEFKPEVKRTPQERQAAAADIQANLAKKERILEAENELLIAAFGDETEKESHEQRRSGQAVRTSQA